MASYYDRFKKEVDFKIKKCETYTEEDEKKFDDCLKNMIENEYKSEEKQETVTKFINKKLIYIIYDGAKFAKEMDDFDWMKKNAAFAKELIKLNPDLISFFDDEVKKNEEVLKYIVEEAPVEYVHPNLNIKENTFLGLKKFVGKDMIETYNAKCKKFKEVKKNLPINSKPHYTDYTNYRFSSRAK